MGRWQSTCTVDTSCCDTVGNLITALDGRVDWPEAPMSAQSTYHAVTLGDLTQAQRVTKGRTGLRHWHIWAVRVS